MESARTRLARSLKGYMRSDTGQVRGLLLTRRGKPRGVAISTDSLAQPNSYLDQLGGLSVWPSELGVVGEWFLVKAYMRLYLVSQERFCCIWKEAV
jgi:hypothetical protein